MVAGVQQCRACTKDQPEVWHANFSYVGAQYVPYYYQSVLNYTAYYNQLESNYIPYLWQSTIIQYVNEDQMTLIVKQEQPIS